LIEGWGRWSSRWTIPAEGGRQSGWGDLLGGAVIVLRRVDTGEHHVGEVPLVMFQGAMFEAKRYLKKAVEIVRDGIEALNVNVNESLHVCSGYILSEARTVLKEQGFRIIPTKITGATQELAEVEFIKSLVRLGIGGEENVAGMRRFKSFLGWVLEDLEDRERFVKTGWPSWPRIKREGRSK
jgi:hypothetical protein